MDTKIKYMAYLILAFTIFNFFYDTTSFFNGFTLYHGYLICLVMVIVVLLRLKVSQSKQEDDLIRRQKELEHKRWYLSQVKCLEDLKVLDADAFKILIQQLFQSYGVEIDTDDSVVTQGMDLSFWEKGEKYIVRIQTKDTPYDVMTELKLCNGIKYDTAVLADHVIYVSTQICEDEIKAYANRNSIYLIDGEALMMKFKEQQIKPQISQEMDVCL